MDSPADSRSQHSWQFSGRQAFLRLAAAPAGESAPEPAGTVDRMAEAIEALDRATADGWRLVDVKLLREVGGLYRLDARLARPESIAKGPRPPRSAGADRAA